MKETEFTETYWYGQAACILHIDYERELEGLEARLNPELVAQQEGRGSLERQGQLKSGAGWQLEEEEGVQREWWREDVLNK